MAKNRGFYPWLKSIFGKKVPPATCVYAGPEQMNKRPRDNDDRKVMEEVYAGPGYFGPGTEEPDPEELEDAENVEELTKLDGAEGAECSPVFGQIPPERIPDPREFMCVYAGPEYFNRGSSEGVAGVAVKTRPCDKCGEEYPDGNLQCPVCGARRVFEDGTVGCLTCGAHIRPDAKFCGECGAKNEPYDVDAKV